MAPPRPPKELLFCPRQDCLEDVAVYLWYFSKGATPYLQILDALRKRQLQLSPFIVQGPKGTLIPITPLKNPKTKMSSHFIIRMIDDDDLRYMVDCLVRDSDYYFVGFRRHLQLTKEEEMLEEMKRKEREKEAGSSQNQKKTKKKGQVDVARKSGWGKWRRFRDQDMAIPAFFKAIILNVSAAYKGINFTRPGGVPAIRKMFSTFAVVEDDAIAIDVIEEACYCFMATISEPSRMLCSKNEIVKRVVLGEEASPVSADNWRGMHSWTRKGRVILEYRLYNRLEAHYRLPTWLQCIGLRQIRDLIGEKGEILLINNDRTKMGIPEDEILKIEEESCKVNAGPADRVDPGLKQPLADLLRR